MFKNRKHIKRNTKINLKLNFVNRFGIVRVFNVKISKFSRGK